MQKIAEYKNPNTESRLEVFANGKSFVSVRHYPATRHSAAESVKTSHRAYSGVEKVIARGNFVEVKSFLDGFCK